MTDCMPEYRSVEVAPGRKLYTAIYGGPLDPAKPLVLSDSGAFGIYADSAHIAHLLAAQGVQMIAYSRAGIYRSDPMPEGAVPDPFFHAQDMMRLLDALSVTQQIVVMAHSMGGLRARALAQSFPERVAGMVLLDAVIPQQLTMAGRRKILRQGAKMISLCTASAKFKAAGRVLQLYPNFIGLTGQGRRDKSASLGDPQHFAATRAEILASTEPVLAPRFLPITVPVAAMTATLVAHGTEKMLAQVKARGIWTKQDCLKGVGHAKMLSPRYAPRIARLVMATLAEVEGPQIGNLTRLRKSG